jgi:hypothetical protein
LQKCQNAGTVIAQQVNYKRSERKALEAGRIESLSGLACRDHAQIQTGTCVIAMELIYVIVADAAQASLNGKFSVLGGGVENIYAPAFPAVYPGLALVIRLSVQASEANQSHDFRVDIAGPNDFHVAAGSIAEFRSVALHEEPDRPSTLNVVMNMPLLVFPEPGKYLLRLYVDTNEVGDYPLYVLESNPNDVSSQVKQDQ